MSKFPVDAPKGQVVKTLDLENDLQPDPDFARGVLESLRGSLMPCGET